jgi:glycosyltransferase involved in cell wall biosynthesis
MKTLSIITPSYNQERYLEQNIRSVQAQDYPHVEHIIIDGGSSDRTVEVLKRFPHLVWVSEKDRGQADALNKGLARATGEIVGWINSDDYYQERIFKSVVEQFDDPDTLWVIGNLTCVFEGRETCVVTQSPRVTLERLLWNPDIVRQQPAFFRRDLLVRAGGWNPTLFMTMDFDLWVRLAKMAPPKMVDRQWAYFRFHADQKTSLKNYRTQERELLDILRREKAPRQAIVRLRVRKRMLMIKHVIKDRLIRLHLLDRTYRFRPIRIPHG